jgi:methylenetetrahydrofolate dehydrogenase (NADP+)/methenyltetrahydrofolate cyclohydrolase
MGLINCEKIAKQILADVDGGTLVVLRNYDDASAVSYVRQLCKIARQVNIRVIEEDYASHSIPDRLTRIIHQYNDDEEVHGIIVVSPQPQHYPCLQEIHPDKRVEGNDFDDNPLRVSCTARACVEIADSVLNSFECSFLVVGYGKAVGKPLGYLLMRMHAGSVTTTHEYTSISELFNHHIPNNDVIISAVGSPHFIKGDYEEKLFIDAGISVANGRVQGDIHPDLVEKNDVTPVPGGVGPVTTALLMRNVTLASKGEF